ncbi:ABC transporter permease [Alkalihalobacillus sp. NPDC078783]
MNKFFIYTTFQTKLLLRNYKSTIIGFLMPVLMFIIFSNVFSDFDIAGSDNTLVDYLIPAFIPIIIINAVVVIYGQYYSLYEEQGNLVKYRLLGLNRFSISFGLFLSTLIFQLFAILILIGVAVLTTDVPIAYDNLHNVIIVLAVINLYQYSIAVLIFSFIKKSTTYQSIALIAFNYQMFLGGLTFPPEIFPDVLKTMVEYLNPVYYALLAMRGVWTENENVFDYYQELGIVMIVTVVFLAVGTFVSNRKKVA